ncbi:Tryptophan synthase alpha chain [uncultured archaeon]|nr:Tryptophan synthase alpha chain [uncultured archaeon]
MMFIPYISCGDPDVEFSRKLVQALAPHSDLIELGIPFSDPLADGPTIQAASSRALAGGMNTDKALEMVKKLRADGVKTPFVFMTYYNVIYAYGTARFMQASREAGVQGVLVPDVPMGEDEELEKEVEKNGLFIVQLIATNTPDERARKILQKEAAGSFTYLVSVAGTTGERKKVADESLEFVKRIRKLAANNSSNRLCVGFGVSDAEAGRQFVQAGADGVIVGSKLISMYVKNIKDRKKVEGEEAVLAEIAQFAKSFKQE